MDLSIMNGSLKGTHIRQSSSNRLQSRNLAWNWCAVCAVCGLAGGLVTVLVGSVLTATSWVSGTSEMGHSIHTLGTVLLIITIPLFICGAHYLDLWDNKKSEAKKERSIGKK
jgi:high-affinity Fe2+/Pb2+ permease